MRKIIVVLVLVLAAEIGISAKPAQAQEAAKDTSSAPEKNKPVQSYRLDFSFNEIVDGRSVNTRHYSMNLIAGTPNEIKIGTRVPVASGSTPNRDLSYQYQYLDIGTTIWSQLREHADELTLAVRAEVSNLDVPTGDHGGAMLPPVVRQIKIDGETLLIVGKPIVIGGVDDPNSKRQFQLEVTVTKVR
jgi:hypothetical protein